MTCTSQVDRTLAWMRSEREALDFISMDLIDFLGSPRALALVSGLAFGIHN